MKPSKSLSILLSLALAVFSLSAAIAFPILCRPFYYRQIGALGLPEATGWNEQTIRGAYDEVMDYLVYGAPFGTGELRSSDDGQAHFADCRTLFRLDFVLLGVSTVALAVLAVLYWTFAMRFTEGLLSLSPLVAAIICLAALAVLACECRAMLSESKLEKELGYES